MHDWTSIIPILEEVIKKHISLVSAKNLNQYAETIWSAYIDGMHFNAMLALDHNPEDEIQQLIKAANHIRLAHEFISKTGRIGEDAMAAASASIGRSIFPLTHKQENSSYRDYISCALGVINEIVGLAIKKVDPSTLTMVAILSGNHTNPKSQSGRRQNHVADRVTEKALQIFEDVTGQKASATHDAYRETSTSTGKCHDYLTDIFTILEITANAEHCITKYNSKKMKK